MRILVLADIHANWPALRAINEPHDVCLFLGDLVDYNLDPVPCIDWVREHAHHAVRGNHDHGVAQDVTVQARNGFKYLTAVTRALTQQRLTPEHRRFLARLPVTRYVTLDETRYFLVHASPRDPLDEFNLPDVEYWQRRLEGVEADVVCVGHTHHPYVVQVGDKLVVNPGSVGQPRDGNPQASYAVIEGDHVELKRTDYPVDETVRTILQSSLPDPAKALLAQVLRTGSLPRAGGNARGRAAVNGALRSAAPSDGSGRTAEVQSAAPGNGEPTVASGG